MKLIIMKLKIVNIIILHIVDIHIFLHIFFWSLLEIRSVSVRLQIAVFEFLNRREGLVTRAPLLPLSLDWENDTETTVSTLVVWP